MTTKVEGSDTVNHPVHYNHGKIECIEFIEDQGFGFHLGNAVKYITRSGHKGKEVEDLEKAVWYIRRHVELVIGARDGRVRRPNQMPQGRMNRRGPV